MTAASPSRPRRSRAGLFLFLLLLACGAWELAARVAAPPATPTPLRVLSAAWTIASGGQVGGGGAPSDDVVAKMAYRPLPYVMWGLKPNWARDTSVDGKQRTSNALGFRGGEVEMPKPAGRYRIVCLGGSTTYSEAVGDADAYPAVMQDLLRSARPDRDIEVVNAGIPSYTTAESLANLAFRVLDLQPDAIVIYHAANDYRPRTYRNFDSAYFHYRKLWDGSTRLFREGEGELKGLNAFVQNMPPEPNGNKADNVKRAGTWAFRRNLTSMAGIASAHGVKTVLVSFVADEVGEYSDKDLTAGIAEHNAVIREVAEAVGALYIDIVPDFPQGQGLFQDPVHLNEKGTHLKARLIADGLLAGLW